MSINNTDINDRRVLALQICPPIPFLCETGLRYECEGCPRTMAMAAAYSVPQCPYRSCFLGSRGLATITRYATPSRSTADDPVLSALSKPEVDRNSDENKPSQPPFSYVEKELSKTVRKTAATFAPRASTASRNFAVPGSTLYSIFETQGYLSMGIGGLLAFNLLFPSNEPDIWRLMGMWSVWMFTIPSLRARDCSSKEKKDVLNYLFLIIPLVNVLLPLIWKSFAAVWSAVTKL